MKREINFRLGSGFRRERAKALSASGLIAAFRALGLSDQEIKQKLIEMGGKSTPKEKT